MKIKFSLLIFTLSTAAALCETRRTIPLTVSVAAVGYVQNATTAYNSTLTDLAPVKYKLACVDILRQAAIDENAIGNYAFTNFPT